MSSSKTAERMFENLMGLCGYDNVCDYASNKLVEVANQVRPGRVDNVAAKRKEAGLRCIWDSTSPKLVVDWVYGLDYVIAPSGNTNSLRFGFDVTLNADKVKDKELKLQEFQPLWSAIGITKVAVVLLVVPSDFGFALLSKSQKDKLVDEVLEGLIYPMSEESAVVRKYILTV